MVSFELLQMHSFNSNLLYEIQDTVFYWSKDDVTFSGQVKTDKAEEFCDYEYDDTNMAVSGTKFRKNQQECCQNY